MLLQEETGIFSMGSNFSNRVSVQKIHSVLTQDASLLRPCVTPVVAWLELDQALNADWVLIE